MLFDAEIMKDKSLDPYFRIKFSYEEKDTVIKYGIAEIIRNAPVPKITYDNKTKQILENRDRSKLELELLNTVIAHLLSKGIYRTFKGKVILSA